MRRKIFEVKLIRRRDIEGKVVNIYRGWFFLVGCVLVGLELLIKIVIIDFVRGCGFLEVVGERGNDGCLWCFL